MELPKTEQELNDFVEAKVNEATEKLVAKHNSDMANMRKKYDDDIRKTKEQVGLTAQELADQKIKEQQEADQKELNDLRAYKKSNEISTRLAKEGLPSYFKNDTRLLNASDTDIDKVIKDVKKEYESTLPKGATHSTIIQTAQSPVPKDNKDKVNEMAGDALKQALGR